jgi:lysylphosphatidylglycerol synthetase-like protein (DUF2156 family)
MADLPARVRASGDLALIRRRRTRVGAIVALAGCLDLVSAAGPPLHHRLRVLELVVPLVVSQTATALVALAGAGLLVLAWGIQRGQRQAWGVASALLGATALLHLVKGVDIVSALAALVVLVVLLATHGAFTAPVDGPSRRVGLLIFVLGALTTTVLATLGLELGSRVDHDGPVPPVGRAAMAVGQRLVGIHSVALPAGAPRALDWGLLSTGIVLLALASALAFRPLVDRRRGTPLPSRRRARLVVARYGSGSLDYFALRNDKQHFFYGDTLVTYAVYGGVCLVSPDPIGPKPERLEAFDAFRRFADAHGWKVAALGTGEEWLATYQRAGMRHRYIGDEAVVDVASFHLEGGRHKSLRQAVNRVARHGYTVGFFDPAALDPAFVAALDRLRSKGRRGGAERGFSMTLGRIFDPEDEGLLLAVAFTPSGEPAAFCQFVPAPGIGGYSLDLMRRDNGAHPNGVIDFLVVATIEHLRARQMRGLALNFAAMRALIASSGGTVGTRIARAALRRLSRSMQIESLWRFTAKYEPTWVARHVVYDRASDLPAIALAIARAESFVELPFLGRLLTLRLMARPWRTRLVAPSGS